MNVRQVVAQPLQNFFFFSLVKLPRQFVQAEVHDVVMVKFGSRQFVAQAAARSCVAGRLLSSSALAVRPQIKNLLLPRGHEYFQVTGGRGSGMFSQPMPISRACSAIGTSPTPENDR